MSLEKGNGQTPSNAPSWPEEGENTSTVNPKIEQSHADKAKQISDQPNAHITQSHPSPEIPIEDVETSSKRKRKRRYTKNSYGRPHKPNRFKNLDESGNQTDNDGQKRNSKAKNIRKDNRLEAQMAPPHNGSFASLAMQELYDVKLQHVSGSSDVEDDDDDGANSKKPKKKVALFVGFLGTNYAGMQINQNIKSIQAYIELALYRANYISQSNFGYPSKYSWSNSARTDKGVHSCAQVCSTKVAVPIASNTHADVKTTLDPKQLGADEAPTTIKESQTCTDWDAVRQNINDHLPADIRILDVVRVTRKFCAKSQRNKVRYQYMVPSFVLQHHSQIRKIFQSVGLDHPLEKNRETYLNPFTAQQIVKLLPLVSTYRATAEDLDRLESALKAFQGTHSFHNYTNGKTSADPSAKRYILDFCIMGGTPMLDPKSGMEWIPLWITGQSFLLHQIRKMMTMVIDVTRQMADMDVLQNSLSRTTQMMLTIAPAQGLFLDMSYFDSYNRKKEVQSKTFDRLDWHSQFDNNNENESIKRWREFKENVVMKHIMEEETKEANFLKYIYWQEFVVDKSRYWPNKVMEVAKSAESEDRR